MDDHRDSTTTDPDNWYGVQDPKKRKQIQDRLAQRARRQRLAKQKAAGTTGRKAWKSRDSSVTTDQGRDLSIDPDHFTKPTTNVLAVIPSIASDAQFLTDTAMALNHALWENGKFFNLVCSMFPSTTPPADSKVPLALQPTETQLTTIHIRWIDRMPFPRLRDNFINLSTLIDEDEFVGDLCARKSFKIREGGASWDPSAWLVSRDFEKRWGFLFYDSGLLVSKSDILAT